MMTPEWRAFSRRLLDPRMVAAAVPHFVQQVNETVRRRRMRAQGPGSAALRIPPYAAAQFPVARPVQSGIARLPSTGLRTAPTPPRLPTRLELASTTVLADSPDWYQTFPDREDTAALHRWRWLLPPLQNGACAQVAEWGLRLAEDWCARGPKVESHADHLAWEAYTASERIVNLLLFASCSSQFLAGHADRWNHVFDEMSQTAWHVATHLEYLHERTNNHLLNNARALYIAGRFLKQDNLANLGRTILLRETPRMFTPDGFLREGSSHYHLVLTRSYIEILWAAMATDDNAVHEALATLVRDMIARARFLIVTSGSPAMPLVGDVSPDCEPEWLLCMPWSRPARGLLPASVPHAVSAMSGWAALWENGEPVQCDNSTRHGVESWPSSGWYRYDAGALTMFWRVEPNGALPVFASHGHHDVGSFVAFWNGVPVIVDPGRSTYNQNALGRYGLSAFAHNTIVVDDHEPFVLHRRNWFPPRYRDARAWASVKENEDSLGLTVWHDGYRRLGDGICVERRFTCTAGVIEIEDHVNGVGVHDVRARFQLAANAHASLSDSTVSIRSRVGVFKLSVSSPVDVVLESGWVSVRYGHAVAAPQVCVGARVELPVMFRYTLRAA